MGRGMRWVAVLAATALLCSMPALVARRPAHAERVDPAALIAKIRGSSGVGYSGLAESRGALGLPDLPRLGRLADLLSGTTRLRVWYAGPHRLRVDRLTPIGEVDAYVDEAGGWVWESEDRDSIRMDGTPTLRLPEPRDLLPPELGRRLTAAAATARLEALPARRVGGHEVTGVRVRPLGVTTVDHIDLWADPGTGLPMRVDVIARGQRNPSVTTRFLDVRLGRPDRGVTTFIPPLDSPVRGEQVPDIVAAIDRYAPYELPAQVAGLPKRPRVSGVGGGAATYGDGYTLLAVVPLRGDFAASLLDRILGAAEPIKVGGVPSAPLSTPLVKALVVAAEPGFLLAGTVPLATLQRAGAELTRRNLPFRTN